MEFAPIKKKLIEATTHKASNDWILNVRNNGLDDCWNTDKEYVMRAMMVRVKYKVVPRFSSWVEI